MPDDPYTLADLARLADVTPRTVRYYVAQGLLPSPEAAGPATRYGERHLVRLRLIRRLQRDHLPLAEIRARLERMGDDEVEAALDAEGPAEATPPMNTEQTLAYVRELMTRAGVAPRLYGQPAGVAPALAKRVVSVAAASTPPLLRDVAPPAAAAPPPPTDVSSPGSASLRQGSADRSTWERLAITPDVEVHVRRPLDRAANKRVERLIRIARELFDEDG